MQYGFILIAIALSVSTSSNANSAVFECGMTNLYDWREGDLSEYPEDLRSFWVPRIGEEFYFDTNSRTITFSNGRRYNIDIVRTGGSATDYIVVPGDFDSRDLFFRMSYGDGYEKVRGEPIGFVMMNPILMAVTTGSCVTLVKD